MRTASGLWSIVVPHRLRAGKAHVSATIRSAEEVLRRVLPVLAGEGVSFKVATRETLGTLNSGLGSLSQIGKIYHGLSPG